LVGLDDQSSAHDNKNSAAIAATSISGVAQKARVIHSARKSKKVEAKSSALVSRGSLTSRTPASLRSRTPASSTSSPQSRVEMIITHRVKSTQREMRLIYDQHRVVDGRPVWVKIMEVEEGHEDDPVELEVMVMTKPIVRSRKSFNRVGAVRGTGWRARIGILALAHRFPGSPHLFLDENRRFLVNKIVRCLKFKHGGGRVRRRSLLSTCNEDTNSSLKNGSLAFVFPELYGRFKKKCKLSRIIPFVKSWKIEQIFDASLKMRKKESLGQLSVEKPPFNERIFTPDYLKNERAWH